MKQYLQKRLLGLVIVLVGVSILSFLLLAFSGVDAAEAIARRNNINASEEAVEAIRIQMGLDQSLPMQYLNWVKGFFTGDLGVSLYSAKDISRDLATYFPTTFFLVGLSLVWILVLSISGGLLSARFRNRAADHVTRVATLIGICLPTFWLGFLLLLAFAVKIPIFSVVAKTNFKGFILPSIALALPVSCSIIRLLRSTLLEELSSDYVQYARARGLSPSRILIGHVFRNALPPILVLFCQNFGSLIAGSAVVESVFSIKGIGSYIIACVLAYDSRSVATCIVIIAVIFVLANLAGDVLSRVLCPWMVREANE